MSSTSAGKQSSRRELTAGRPNKPRDSEREDFRSRWEAAFKRRKEGHAPGDLDWHNASAVVSTSTFDEQGNPVTITVAGKNAIADVRQAEQNPPKLYVQGKKNRRVIVMAADEANAERKNDQYFAAMLGNNKRHSGELRAKVERWNRKGDDDKKDISGKDVIEVLELAYALTHDPSLEAAAHAMRRHQLHTGGLRNAFRKLLRVLGHVESHEIHWRYADKVDHHITELDYERSLAVGAGERVESDKQFQKRKFRRAVEHVVATFGLGHSFEDGVDKLRKAYKEKDKQQHYLDKLYGLPKDRVQK